MSCCGQKRQVPVAGTGWQERLTMGGTAPPAPAAVPADGSSGPTVTLVSRDGSVTSITGRVTGKRYRFQGAGAMQAVDRRDVDAMISTGAFERVWG